LPASVMPPLNEHSLQQILDVLIDLAPESYVVGGAIRDALWAGLPCTDLDVVVQGDGCDVARRAATIIGSVCSFVPLDPGRGTARLVFKDGGIPAVDISTFKGATIREDLVRRDFTINAIAVRTRDFLTMGREQLVDPCRGAADLRAKTISACSDDSFEDDPLRILRAFRFASAFGFTIDSHTMGLMPRFLSCLPSVAGERIRDELFAILAAPRSFPILQDMDANGVMTALFPEFSPMKGCTQNEYHHLDVWAHSLEAVRTMEGLLNGERACVGPFQQSVVAYAGEELVPGRPRRALMKLAALFHDSGKPHTRFVDDRGRVRFFGHDAVSTEIFARVADRLKLSARERRTGEDWIQGHMRPIVLFSQPVSRRTIFRLWRKFGEDIVGLFVLFLADLAATRGPARPAGTDQDACESVRTALEITLELGKTPIAPLVNGWDLMDALGLAPGPKIGHILDRLAEMQASGDITTRDEALAAAKQFM
jgi:poly(A) polymerase